jgi:hypothetical protein
MHTSFVTKTTFAGFANLFKGIILLLFGVFNIIIFIYDYKYDYDTTTNIWLFNSIVSLLGSIIYLYLYKLKTEEDL